MGKNNEVILGMFVLLLASIYMYMYSVYSTGKIKMLLTGGLTLLITIITRHGLSVHFLHPCPSKKITRKKKAKTNLKIYL